MSMPPIGRSYQPNPNILSQASSLRNSSSASSHHLLSILLHLKTPQVHPALLQGAYTLAPPDTSLPHAAVRPLSISTEGNSLFPNKTECLFILDSHAQNLPPATSQCTYVTVARNTHHTSALVLYWKNIQGFVRLTHHLDQTLADIVLLRNEVDEAWK
jgi:hypothetical protein